MAASDELKEMGAQLEVPVLGKRRTKSSTARRTKAETDERKELQEGSSTSSAKAESPEEPRPRVGAVRREPRPLVLPENDADIPFDPMSLPEPPGGYTGVLSKPVDPSMPKTGPARLPDRLLVERARLAVEDEEALRQKNRRLGLGSRTNPLTTKLKSLFADALEEAADCLLGRSEEEFKLVPLNPVRVVLALSGGRDSMALLDIAARFLKDKQQALLAQLTAVYVNHGLSPNASDWEAHCRTECERRGIPFRAVAVKVTPQGDGIEARARELRYKALAKEAESLGADIIMTAHHEDDRIETFLIQWLRGAGPEGLAAFPRERLLSGIDAVPRMAPEDAGSLFGTLNGPRSLLLVRPWCGVPAAEIHRYARNMRLKWVEDESNKDPRFIRNRIRNEVLPLLEAIRPGFRAAAARSVALVAQTADVLKSVAQTDLEGCRSKRNAEALSIFALLRLVPARQAWCLRAWLLERGLPPPSKAKLDELLRQLREAGTDINLTIRMKDREVRRWGSDLVVRRAAAEASPEERSEKLFWTGADWVLPAWGGVLAVIPCRDDEPGISVERLESAEIEVSNRRGGQRVQLWANRPASPLKDLYIAAQIPAFERPGLPLLRVNGRIVYAAGLGNDLREADDPATAPNRVRFVFRRQAELWEGGTRADYAELSADERRAQEVVRRSEALERRREGARREIIAAARREKRRR